MEGRTLNSQIETLARPLTKKPSSTETLLFFRFIMKRWNSPGFLLLFCITFNMILNKTRENAILHNVAFFMKRVGGGGIPPSRVINPKVLFFLLDTESMFKRKSLFILTIEKENHCKKYENLKGFIWNLPKAWHCRIFVRPSLTMEPDDDGWVVKRGGCSCWPSGKSRKKREGKVAKLVY